MCRACSGEACATPDGETPRSYVSKIPRTPDCDYLRPVASLGQIEGYVDGIQDGEVRCLECGHPLQLQPITLGTAPVDGLVGEDDGGLVRAIPSDKADELNARFRKSRET